MIAKPTTEQILNDCSRELMEVVLPAISDETVKVTVMMMDLVLRNAAVRAAHEVAWMTAETTELNAFAGDAGASSLDLDDSLHLDDVIERYRQASEAFSQAMEDAIARGDEALADRGAALMASRSTQEQEVMCGWSPVGR